MNRILKNPRLISIVAFSFLFTHLLSFLFQGQTFYALIDLQGIKGLDYILITILVHFLGLISCGFWAKTLRAAKKTMLSSMALCFIAAGPFFLNPSPWWMLGLVISGYSSGCAVASWGYFLKAYTPKNERLKSCADVLIYSNLLMITVNIIAVNVSAYLGLSFSLLFLLVGMVFLYILPTKVNTEGSREKTVNQTYSSIQKPLLLLSLFIFIITINSGLMYQVINPAFEHLQGLVTWYWAVPYITALIIMRNLSAQVQRANILYAAMLMMVGAFISFMLLGRGSSDYLVINTMMLAACGVFDLFWWSILGEMLEHTDNPARIFGQGLAANVAGVLCGIILGMTITAIRLPGAELTVIALTVVCLTLVLLPPLNQQLILLLRNHTYLTAFHNMNENQQTAILDQTEALTPLTVREQEVLQLILSGKSNREIAASLFISENTVKTHARNIFSKYDVASRAELISNLLRQSK